VLELVELGMVLHELEHTLDCCACTGAITPRPGHEADEDGIFAIGERGHTKDLEAVHRVLVLALEGGKWRPGFDLDKNRVRIGTCFDKGFAHDVLVSEVLAEIVACRKERPMGHPEHLGKAVTHNDPSREGEMVGQVNGIVPGKGGIAIHVSSRKGKGTEGHVPVGAVVQGIEHVLVRVPGKRAAIIEVYAEGGHRVFNPLGVHGIPARGLLQARIHLGATS
jgi:hypothetical protein